MSSSTNSPPTAIPTTAGAVSTEFDGGGEAEAGGVPPGVDLSAGGEGVLDGGEGAVGVPGVEGGGVEGIAGVPGDWGGAEGVAGGDREGGAEEAGAGGDGEELTGGGAAVRGAGGGAVRLVCPGAAGVDDIAARRPRGVKSTPLWIASSSLAQSLASYSSSSNHDLSKTARTEQAEAQKISKKRKRFSSRWWGIRNGRLGLRPVREEISQQQQQQQH